MLLKSDNQPNLRYSASHAFKVRDKGIMRVVNVPNKESAYLYHFLTTFKPTVPLTSFSIIHGAIQSYAEGVMECYQVSIAVTYRYYPQSKSIIIDSLVISMFTSKEEFTYENEESSDALHLLIDAITQTEGTEDEDTEMSEHSTSVNTQSSCDCEFNINMDDNFKDSEDEEENVKESDKQPEKKRHKAGECNQDCKMHLPSIKKLLDDARTKHFETYLEHYSGYSKKHNPSYSQKAEGEIIMENLFDKDGNYRYCRSCIVEIVGVNKNKLAKYRKKKLTNAPVHGLAGKKSQ